MRRRRVIIVLAACVFVGIGVVAFWPGEREPKEPEYNGKKFSEWLRPYVPRYSDRVSASQMNEADKKMADNAVRQIGTNALPWIVKWIGYEPPAWKVQFWRILGEIPVKSVRRFATGNYLLKMVYFRADAEMAFRILGPQAAPAAPRLSNIVRGSRSEHRRVAAVWALRAIGKEGLPTLMDALMDPREDERMKETAALCIVRMCDRGVDISRALPSILMLDRVTAEMAKTNNFDRIYAIGVSESWNPWVLSDTKHPQYLVSALTNCMHHTNLVIQVEAINGLGRLGEVARPAVPALKEALDIPVIAVQEAAINALEKIAPEALTNGVVEDF